MLGNNAYSIFDDELRIELMLGCRYTTEISIPVDETIVRLGGCFYEIPAKTGHELYIEYHNVKSNFVPLLLPTS